ncbi:calumenin-A-like [Brevipalpus obovatus]|uniref:calumenin-A-like n=1 Tax=Brevipalpus obovatus TaxID=246614 RepID=UPI003D9F95E6
MSHLYYLCRLFSYFLLIISFVIFVSSKEKDTHDHLSDETHYGSKNEHNTVYDHEAFLGEQARSFENLSPEESRKRLALIVDKMDTNGDGYVSYDELKDHIHKAQKLYIMEDVDKQWKTLKPKEEDESSTITWEEYKLMTYGFMDELKTGLNEEDTKTYKDMMRRDDRRWKMADNNGDGLLNRDEFADFLHPEEAEHMSDVVVDETLEDVDKDADGKISLTEYITDMYPSEETGGEVPDWVVREKEQFNNFRDKDKDGFLDREEVKEWIIPQDYDHSGTEAKHLIHESDKDKDGLLSKEEILENYDLFVGSQATDFGEALMKHDEL